MIPSIALTGYPASSNNSASLGNLVWSSNLSHMVLYPPKSEPMPTPSGPYLCTSQSIWRNTWEMSAFPFAERIPGQAAIPTTPPRERMVRTCSSERLRGVSWKARRPVWDERRGPENWSNDIPETRIVQMGRINGEAETFQFPYQVPSRGGEAGGVRYGVAVTYPVTAEMGEPYDPESPPFKSLGRELQKCIGVFQKPHSPRFPRSMIRLRKRFRGMNGLKTLQVLLGVFQQISEIIRGLHRAVIDIHAIKDGDDDPHPPFCELRQAYPGIGQFLKRYFRMAADQVIEKINMTVNSGIGIASWLFAHGLSLRRFTLQGS